MKRKYDKILLTLIISLLLIIPANVDAFISLKGTSASGNIKTTLSVLIPLPLIRINITESGATDFFGIAQLTIIEHDDNKKANTLQITMGSENPIELPVPYGSFGLKHFLLPGAWPPAGTRQSDIYGYLSVAYGRVLCIVENDIDLSISIEREQLIELLTPFFPEGINLDLFIGEGPFDLGVSLMGDFSGRATLTNPTISGSFDCTITLPIDDIFEIEIPFEIPNEIEGSLSIEASFNWDNWNLFLPFAGVNLTITPNLTYEEEVISIDPISISFDLLPRGTFILWLDMQ